MNITGRAKTVSQMAMHGYVEPFKPKPMLDRKLINLIFSELDKRYPYKWNGQFNGNEGLIAETKNLWATELHGILDEHISMAVSQCSDKFLEWPPTVGQFKHLCGTFVSPHRLRDAKEVLKDTAPKTSNDPDIISATRIINLGAEICKKLKVIYPDKSWYEIGDIFTAVKKKLRPLLDRKTELAFLQDLRMFTVDDLKEAI